MYCFCQFFIKKSKPSTLQYFWRFYEKQKNLDCCFLFTLTMINYMDRIALSIAAKPLAKDFDLNSVQLGYLFSAFTWGYTLFLIPIGYLIDKHGIKKMAGIGISIWSAATILTAGCAGFLSLITARLVMGAGESVSNPVGGKIIRQWIPASERGLITAIFNSGSYAGPAICSVVLGILVTYYGWRLSFIIAGIIGFIWLAAWLCFYNSPEKVNWLSEAERCYIIENRGSSQNNASESESSQGFSALLKNPAIWGLAITQGCNVYTQYLFLTWLPSYLQATLNLDIKSTGAFSALPYAIAVILCVLVGNLSDRYLKKSGGVTTGNRRYVIALSLLAGASVLLVPFTHNITFLLIIFSVALTGVASTTSMNFALLNDILPCSGDVAKAIAFIVVGGNIFGMIAPISTGYVVSLSGNYNWAFGIAGLLLLAGIIIILTTTRTPKTRNVGKQKFVSDITSKI